MGEVYSKKGYHLNASRLLPKKGYRRLWMTGHPQAKPCERPGVGKGAGPVDQGPDFPFRQKGQVPVGLEADPSQDQHG
jgi:hypothetical protein